MYFNNIMNSNNIYFAICLFVIFYAYIMMEPSRQHNEDKYVEKKNNEEILYDESIYDEIIY